ncbi:MAG TPA: VOC family protein [Pseudonocardiaceae bacterium]|jgi:catechol 2,3-dioxygenase-like lactoylglutathione lyase family enzyme|nr:VOC family protein [Pseudonocardiaceae bacterium]
MSVRWYTVVIDCADVQAQARWWAEVLGWVVAYESDDEMVIVPTRAMSGQDIPLDEQGPGLVFVPVPEGKTIKNRLHIDLAPGPDDDHAAEVARLERLGAKRVDVGQGDVRWVVLADPEGNEFCVLTPRD